MGTSNLHLPVNNLLEFVFRLRCWLSLQVIFAHGGVEPLPERRRTGPHQAWWRGRLAQMGMIVCLSIERPLSDGERSSDVRECQ